MTNLGYVCADRGSLPYDYPYVEANGAQASSRNLTNNSTGTCDYIEVPAQENDHARPRQVKFVVPNSPSNISKQSSIVSPLSSDPQSAYHNYVNTNYEPARQNGTRALLLTTKNGAGVSTNANTSSDPNGYVNLRS